MILALARQWWWWWWWWWWQREVDHCNFAASLVFSLSYWKGVPRRLVIFFIYYAFFKDLFIIICKYTVAVFRHTRRGSQILLQMVVSHHVVAGI